MKTIVLSLLSALAFWACTSSHSQPIQSSAERAMPDKNWTVKDVFLNLPESAWKGLPSELSNLSRPEYRQQLCSTADPLRPSYAGNRVRLEEEQLYLGIENLPLAPGVKAEQKVKESYGTVTHSTARNLDMQVFKRKDGKWLVFLSIYETFRVSNSNVIYDQAQSLTASLFLLDTQSGQFTPTQPVAGKSLLDLIDSKNCLWQIEDARPVAMCGGSHDTRQVLNFDGNGFVLETEEYSTDENGEW